MFVAPWPARNRDKSSLKVTSRTQCSLFLIAGAVYRVMPPWGWARPDLPIIGAAVSRQDESSARRLPQLAPHSGAASEGNGANMPSIWLTDRLRLNCRIAPRRHRNPGTGTWIPTKPSSTPTTYSATMAMSRMTRTGRDERQEHPCAVKQDAEEHHEQDEADHGSYHVGDRPGQPRRSM
jgi:hypothetical protein